MISKVCTAQSAINGLFYSVFLLFCSIQSVWDGDACNRLHGTDSTIFPPFLKPSEGLWTFTPDICMSTQAHYVRKSSFAGLPTSYYSIDFGNFKVVFFQSYYDDDDETFKKYYQFRMTRTSNASATTLLMTVLPLALWIFSHALALAFMVKSIKSLHFFIKFSSTTLLSLSLDFRFKGILMPFSFTDSR
jgi:hypothetical protein